MDRLNDRNEQSMEVVNKEEDEEYKEQISNACVYY